MTTWNTKTYAYNMPRMIAGGMYLQQRNRCDTSSSFEIMPGVGLTVGLVGLQQTSAVDFLVRRAKAGQNGFQLEGTQTRRRFLNSSTSRVGFKIRPTVLDECRVERWHRYNYRCRLFRASSPARQSKSRSWACQPHIHTGGIGMLAACWQ